MEKVEREDRLIAFKQEFLAPFPVALVRIRSKPTIQPYITARAVQDRLDEVVPFGWSFTLGERWFTPDGVLHQVGRLEVMVGDRSAAYEDVGTAPKDMPNVQAKQSKQAVSDAMKRCGVAVGIGRYLYGLQCPRADGLLQSAVEKAVREVGWRGAIEPHYFGRIGGLRDLDREDEDAESNGGEPGGAE
jgi:hypothetical protein